MPNHFFSCRIPLTRLFARLGLLVGISFIAACGGGSGGSSGAANESPPAPVPTDPVDDNPHPDSATWPMSLQHYLGSLYQTFPWSGSVRDPYRDMVELHPPAAWTPLTDTDLASIAATLAERDIIMQIGGMGSAKRDGDDPGTVNELFRDYMDSVIMDDGAEWRENVKSRAIEVANIVPDDRNLYWQIGNEINSSSYSDNIQLYFNDSSVATIPVYVEYFLAPTLQALQEAAQASGKPVKAALGSVANFSSDSSRDFLNSLMNYQIEGNMAPALAGRQVAELVQLITLHYHMNTGTPEDPEAWRTALEELTATWVNGAVEGVWTTEEVGIIAAQEGAGAGTALRVMSRYLHWISDNRYTNTQSAFFFFGTTDGPQGQRIDDVMDQVRNLTNSRNLYFFARQFSSDNSLEHYAFEVPGREAWLLTSTALGDLTVPVTDIPIVLPLTDVTGTSISAWIYSQSGARELQALLSPGPLGVTVELNESLSLQKTDTLLVWVDN